MLKNTSTDATTPTPTLNLQDKKRLVAEALASLGLDLNDASQAGLFWSAFPRTTISGRVAVVVAIYHPEMNLGVKTHEEDDLVAFTIDDNILSDVVDATKPKKGNRNENEFEN
jgi:hypothetical protein